MSRYRNREEAMLARHMEVIGKAGETDKVIEEFRKKGLYRDAGLCVECIPDKLPPEVKPPPVAKKKAVVTRREEPKPVKEERVAGPPFPEHSQVEEIKLPDGS